MYRRGRTKIPRVKILKTKISTAKILTQQKPNTTKFDWILAVEILTVESMGAYRFWLRKHFLDCRNFGFCGI